VTVGTGLTLHFLYVLFIKYAFDFVRRRHAVLVLDGDIRGYVVENHGFTSVGAHDESEPPPLTLDDPPCYKDYEADVRPAAPLRDSSSDDDVRGEDQDMLLRVEEEPEDELADAADPVVTKPWIEDTDADTIEVSLDL